MRVALLLLWQSAAIDVDLNRRNEQLGKIERRVASLAELNVLGLITAKQ